MNPRQWFSRADLLCISALALAIALKGWERLYFPEWLSRTDIVNQYLPWWTYLGRHLRAGDIPGWNPHQFGGTPFLGDPQSGWMYLPIMAAFALFSSLTAIKVYVIVHLVIAGLSTYAFARVLSFRPIAALAAALAFTFGPFIQHTTYCCNVQAHVGAWIPLALLGVELAMRTRSWSVRLTGWGVTGLAISQMLAGWIGQGAYNGFLLIGSYIAYRTLIAPVIPTAEWQNRIRSLALHGAAVLFIGFGLGAAAVLPRLDVNQETNLAGGNYANVEEVEENTGASVSTVLSRMAAPDFDRRRTTIGAITLALALIGSVLGWRRAPVPYFAAFSVVVLVLNLDTTPVHRLFYLLPGYQQLHEHDSSRILSVLMIGPAILAGMAVDVLPRLNQRRALIPAALPLVGLGLLALVLEPRHRHVVALDQPTTLGTIGLSILIATTILAARVKSRWIFPAFLRAQLPVLIVLLLFWEPSGRDLLGQLRDSPVEPRTISVAESNMDRNDFNDAGDFLQDIQASGDEPFRYLGYNAIDLRTRSNEEGVVYHNRHWSPRYRRLLVGPRSVILGLYDLQGYNPMQLKRTVDLFLTINGQPLDYHDAYVLQQGMDSPWIDVLNVRYIIVPPGISPGRPDLLHLNQQHEAVFDNGLVRVLLNSDAFPYAWVVHEARSESEGAAEALAQVEAGAVNPRTTALLEPGDTLPELALPSNPDRERITVERYEADAISIQAHVEAPGIVVLPEIFDPGWRVEIDGEAAELIPVDGLLRGVAVPGGDHSLEFRYEPWSITLGLAISAVTALALLIGIGGTRRRTTGGRSRRRSSTQAGNPRVHGHDDPPGNGPPVARRSRRVPLRAWTWKQRQPRIRAPAAVGGPRTPSAT